MNVCEITRLFAIRGAPPAARNDGHRTLCLRKIGQSACSGWAGLRTGRRDSAEPADACSVAFARGACGAGSGAGDGYDGAWEHAVLRKRRAALLRAGGAHGAHPASAPAAGAAGGAAGRAGACADARGRTRLAGGLSREGTEDWLQTAVEQRLSCAQTLLRQRQWEPAAAQLAALLGLGIGLTPSGDDFFVRHACRKHSGRTAAGTVLFGTSCRNRCRTVTDKRHQCRFFCSVRWMDSSANPFLR